MALNHLIRLAEKKDESSAMEVESSSSFSNPDQNPSSCPICLGSVHQPSYLDGCFHQFCYKCILRWAKVVSGKLSIPPSSIKCPLCKTESISIIHKWDGNSFQRHYFDQNFEHSFTLSKEHEYRLQCYYTEQGVVEDTFDVSKYWKLQKYSQSSRWLDSWLKRELQALMQEEDVSIVMHHLLGVIVSCLNSNEKKKKNPTKRPESKRKEFEDLVLEAARPFLAGRTDRFVNEVELFLASGLNIKAYDAVYMERLGWSRPETASETSERDAVGGPVAPYLFAFDEDSD